MQAKELAARLNGREIGDEISTVEEKLVQESGLVVVFGASDDLMEFRGAIHDEIAACGGGEALVNTSGLIQDFENIDPNDKDVLRKYFQNEPTGVKIEALWCAQPSVSLCWSFKTTIPHDTFNVMEDGEVYCRGIVFALADAH